MLRGWNYIQSILCFCALNLIVNARQSKTKKKDTELFLMASVFRKPQRQQQIYEKKRNNYVLPRIKEVNSIFREIKRANDWNVRSKTNSKYFFFGLKQPWGDQKMDLAHWKQSAKSKLRYEDEANEKK